MILTKLKFYLPYADGHLYRWLRRPRASYPWALPSWKTNIESSEVITTRRDFKVVEPVNSVVGTITWFLTRFHILDVFNVFHVWGGFYEFPRFERTLTNFHEFGRLRYDFGGLGPKNDVGGAKTRHGRVVKHARRAKKRARMAN